MRKIINLLLIKYERVDPVIRKKAIVLFITIGGIFATLLMVTLIKSLLFDVTSTDIFLHIGLLLGLLFILALNYTRLLKHATYLFILWIVAYFLYLRIEQDILIFLLVPIFFTIIFIIQTSKYQTIYYVVIAFGFLLERTIVLSENYGNNLISGSTYLSYIISLVYIVGFSLFMYQYIYKLNKEIMAADTVVEQSKIDFILDVKKNRKIYNKDKRGKIENSSILLLGVNEIEVLNDSIGYDECESLLKELISLIRETVRVNDYILRWNHDEFLIILHNTALSNSTIVAEKLRKAIEFTGFTELKKRVTVTICATTKGDDQVLYEAIERAQNGLSKAKTQKKNYVLIQ